MPKDLRGRQGRDPLFAGGDDTPPRFPPDDDEAPVGGTLFFDSDHLGDGSDGLLLSGLAALYGDPAIDPTTFDDLVDERWTAPFDPWAGP